ncbi:hypothetical protein AB0H77_15435 [Streptomyces sp. NPDC050844]|uniref:hypothetical protein n=1 Tax=Streptomyces sp. NPDC050844 TaxID=3155790 RepID=UPI0033DC88CC
MTGAERRALLGDKVIDHIHACVAAAPTPPPEVIDDLRRVLTRPAQACAPAEPKPVDEAA